MEGGEELGRCQLPVGAPAAAAGAGAAESCPCAGEGFQQGVQRRQTAAAGPASLGSPTWRPDAAWKSPGGPGMGGGPWAPGSSLTWASGTGRCEVGSLDGQPAQARAWGACGVKGGRGGCSGAGWPCWGPACQRPLQASPDPGGSCRATCQARPCQAGSSQGSCVEAGPPARGIGSPWGAWCGPRGAGGTGTCSPLEGGCRGPQTAGPGAGGPGMDRGWGP